MIIFSRWLDLPMNTRTKIAAEFGLEKKGMIEVFNNTVKSDGYYIKDIENAITTENLQKFVEEPDEKDIVVLWNLMLNKINGVPKSKPPELPSVILPHIPEEQVKIEPKVKEDSELTKVIKKNMKSKKTK